MEMIATMGVRRVVPDLASQSLGKTQAVYGDVLGLQPVIRALTSGGSAAFAQARRQLGRLDQVALTTDLLDHAATLAPDTLLRSPGAIHIAAAQLAGTELRAVVTYDQQTAGVANQLGLPVEAPK